MERKYDLTKGDVFRTILMFMLPILAGNVFQQLYSAVDTIIVGRTLDSDALASVGSIGSLQFLVFSVWQRGSLQLLKTLLVLLLECSV